MLCLVWFVGGGGGGVNYRLLLLIHVRFCESASQDNAEGDLSNYGKGLKNGKATNVGGIGDREIVSGL